MKVLIPVAGAGTRLRPHTYTQPKPLIPVAGKPIISFVIDQLLACGVEDFIFVVGYLGEKIQLFIEKRYPELQKTFVHQQQRQGLGHAVWVARKTYSEAEELLIVLGDTIFDLDIQSLINKRESCLAIKKVDDPSSFGVAEIGADGYISRVIEKPRIPKSNQALVGIYKITEVHALLTALEDLITHDERSHGEYQLTDALMKMIDAGVRFKPYTISNWYDCGKKEVLLRTNAMLLKKEGFATSSLPSFYNTIIIHPVSIGKNCKISNSIIGPNVTIGDNASIKYAIVKESIIGNYAAIAEVVLQYSVVGNDAAITGMRQSLNIGDNTEIDFS